MADQFLIQIRNSNAVRIGILSVKKVAIEGIRVSAAITIQQAN